MTDGKELQAQGEKPAGEKAEGETTDGETMAVAGTSSAVIASAAADSEPADAAERTTQFRKPTSHRFDAHSGELTDMPRDTEPEGEA